MHLWNDYEGKTIADVYSVGSLLRSEGRSALFALTKGPEAPAIIRITESINDEGQMLRCWRQVENLKHENILGIRQFGEATFEGTPLTYAILECPEASLAELLNDRALTRDEALQLASSITAALMALHQMDLIHGHVEPANVLAVGETVKLRADCVRECKVDSEFMTAEDCARLRQNDTQALGELLLRSLTLQRAFRPGMTLPAPFDRIIPRALDGGIGLAEIAAIVGPVPAKPAPAPAEPVPVAASPLTAGPTAPPPTPAQVKLPLKQEAVFEPPKTAAATAEIVESKVAATPTSSATETARLFPRCIDEEVEVEGRNKTPLRVAIGMAAVLMLALLLHVFRGKPAVKSAEIRSVPLAAPGQTAPANMPPAVRPQPASAPAQAHTVQPGWYVIAYTFNHEEQAWKRASAILRQHPSLHPQVIAPHGQYLVALGGAMSRDEAENIRAIARKAGMPRDTFVRNYKGV